MFPDLDFIKTCLNGLRSRIEKVEARVNALKNALKTETDALWAEKAPVSFKPAGKSYLTFSSLSSFTLKGYFGTKTWDGTIEYFASDKTWTVWDGTTTLSAVSDDGEYVLYLRGTGNTVITWNDERSRWVLTGTDIKCIGNIENLLDYAAVASGEHPTMARGCYAFMFKDCTSLTQAPTLPATTLTARCYESMFQYCTALIQAPNLPATTLAEYCYYSMFRGCTGLTQAPALPATTLAESCYEYMFYGCTSLTQAPTLPATRLTARCYSNMFSSCASLTQAPALPATTLAEYCYYSMFHSCTGLTQAPSLLATTLADWCYCEMFRGCASLTQAPALPAKTLTTGCYRYMFSSCDSLTQAPTLPATTLADNCYYSMFQGCDSLTQAPALPATTLAYYCYCQMFQNCTSLTQAPSLPATTLAESCYNGMFKGCTSLKLSSNQVGIYTVAYRIPSSGNGVTATNALLNMFSSTGGNFKGTPSINTTYYLSSGNMIVRETEIATLNGYVDSMIDAAIEEYADSASNPLNITFATIGQIAKITAVDENGKPTEWEAVDMPVGWTVTDDGNGNVVIGEDNG